MGTSKNSLAVILATFFPTDCVVVSHHTTEGMPPSSALPDEKNSSESDDSEYLEVPYPKTLLTASNTRSGWNGLTIKSLAPA